MEPLLGGSNFYNVESNSAVTEELDRLCRICASPNDYLIPIFEGEGLDHKLAMKIEKYLPVKIFESDTLPLNVCYQCASTLIAWHDLFENSIKADKKLRELEDRKVFVDKLSDVEIYDEPLSVGSDNETLDQASTSSAVENLSLDKRLKNLKRSSAKKANKVSAESELSQKSAENEGYQHLSCKAVNGNIIPAGGRSTLQEEMVNKQNMLIKIINSYSTEIDDMQNFAFAKDEENENIDVKFKMTDIKYIPTPTENNVQQKLMRKKITTSNESRVQIENSAEANSCNINLKKLKWHLNVGKDVIITDKVKRYFCHTCPKGFQLKSSLRKHVRLRCKFKTVAPKGTVFTCSTCGERCSSKKSLRAHFLCHREKTACHICGKRFTHNSFKYHIKNVHSVSKNFHCDICDKKLTTKSSILDHMKIHTGEKPIMCSTCGKFFRTRRQLSLHKVSHSDIFSFPCNICDKAFRRSRDLKFHLMNHSGIRCCPCDICGKTFRSKNEVSVHRGTHFDDTPFGCPECDKNFKNAKYLKRHVERIHQK